MSAATRWRALVEHEARRAARNWPARAVFLMIGIELAWFVRPAFEFALGRQGIPVAPAVEQAICGQVSLFMIANLLFLGYTAYDDRGNGMADRLEMVGVRRRERQGSKLAIVFAHQLVTATVIHLGAGWWFGVEWRGSALARMALAVALALCMTLFGYAVVSLSRSAALYNMVCYAAALGFTSASGGLAPYDLLPEWAQVSGRVLPTWWYLRAIDRLAIHDEGFSSVVPNLAVIVGFGAVFLVVGWLASRGPRPRRPQPSSTSPSSPVPSPLRSRRG